MTGPAYVALHSSDWKEAGELEGLVEVEDELEQWREDEDHWRDLHCSDEGGDAR